MNMRMTRDAYEEIVRQDLEWLRRQPRSLERDHIVVVLEHSVRTEYPRSEVPVKGPDELGVQFDENGRVTHVMTSDIPSKFVRYRKA